MSKKSNTIVPKVSYKFPLRRGQKDALNYFKEHKSGVFQLPTGYGKTRVIDECFAHCYGENKLAKMLIIFPRVNQLEQYRRDNPYAVDLSKQSDVSILKAYNNGANVFLITAHSLVSKYDKVQHYLYGEDVFVAVDEIQYYGTEKNKEGDIVDKTWCEYINKLQQDMNASMIGLSATPKKGKATCNLFENVNVTMSYKKALSDKAVKPLVGHSYRYNVTITNKDGEVIELTTEDLGKLYGDKEDRDDVCKRYGLKYDSKTKYFKEMRESNKYITPLVGKPIDRLVDTASRVTFRPQMIINTYSISEAKSVATQINAFNSNLKVEWIGSGKSVKDKSEVEISEITRRFLRKPKADEGKDFNESEHIDILINFRRAAVGLDSVTVTEIVFLTGTNLSDLLKQQIGRGSRIIDGYPDLVCNVSFDSSSYLAREFYTGANIVKFMDGEISTNIESYSESKSFDDIVDSFDYSFNLERLVKDVNFIEVSKEDIKYEIQALENDNRSLGGKDIVIDELYDDDGNPIDNPIWNTLIKVISTAREIQQKPLIEEKARELKRVKISTKANQYASLLNSKMTDMANNGYNIPANVRSDIWKRVNGLKKSYAGSINDSDESIAKHEKFLVGFGAYLKATIKGESINLNRTTVFDWIKRYYNE